MSVAATHSGLATPARAFNGARAYARRPRTEAEFVALLTDGENEIARLLSKGLTSKEMARKMAESRGGVYSTNTVRAFLRQIMIKLGVEKRGQILAVMHDVGMLADNKTTSEPEIESGDKPGKNTSISLSTFFTLRYETRIEKLLANNNLHPATALLLQKNFGLTDRELEAVLCCVASNDRSGTSKEAAALMAISPNTIRAFLRLAGTKMDNTKRPGIAKVVYETSSAAIEFERASAPQEEATAAEPEAQAPAANVAAPETPVHASLG